MKVSHGHGVGLLAAVLLLGAPIAWAQEKLALDRAEAAFLRAHPVWRLAGASAPPFQWIDEKGNFVGIAADYRKLIEERLGVKLKVLRAETWQANLEQLQKRQCDVSLLTSQTPEREAYLNFTAPLLELPPAILTRTETQSVRTLADLNGRRVVVVRGYPVHEKLAADHPELILLPREDVPSALSAVALGDAEAYVGDLASATHAIDRLGIRNLKVAGESPYQFPFCIGVRRDWPEALSMLEKVVASITPEEQAAIRRKWIAMQPSSFPVRRVLVVAVPLAITAALLTLLVLNRRLKRMVVEQKRTQDALRASEERWSFALEGARDGVWDWNVPTKNVFFSRRYETMLGYEEGTLPHEMEEWTKRIHPEDLDQVLDAIQRYLRGDSLEYEVEHRVECRDGSYRWILARGRIMERDAEGKALRMVGTHTDITERKRVELDLESAKDFAENLIQTANAIVIGLDLQGRITIFNRAAEQVTGYTKDELLGEDVWEVLVPRSRFPEVVAAIGPDSTGGLPKDNENPLLTKSGVERFIAWRNGTVHEGGKAIGTISFGIDITERREVENELREHEEQLEQTIHKRTADLEAAQKRLREVTDNVPGAIYQFVMKLDGSFAFTFCSEGFPEMTGCSVEDALRDVNAVWAGMHPDDLVELDRRARYSAATMTNYTQDLRVSNQQGRHWWIRAESEPQRQPDGTTLWNGNIMDITARKRLEEELAVATAASEAANRAKSVFLANMSHEIRTPMNAILGFSRLLLREKSIGGQQRSNLESLHRSGEHLLALINDILEMSKIEAGRIELRESAFDLQAMLEDLERMFRLRADERRLRFGIERSGDVPRYVCGDEARVRQVFINLIGNAVKFTERGKVFARVALAEETDETVRLRVEVSDTGAGIPLEERSRLFRAFEQTASGRSSGAGTGLGLAITREFIRLMGGEIEVASTPGHGSTFTFDLALRRAQASAVPPRDEGRIVRRIVSSDGPVRVLIADDKQENSELMEQTLREVGFETRVVRDGLAAVEAFVEWHPRIVLMDLRMPKLDGLEAMRRIRAVQNGEAVSIIAVTASVFEEDRQQVIAAGGDEFLAKPFLDSVLLNKIQQVAGIEYEYADEAIGEVHPEFEPVTPEKISIAISPAIQASLREAAMQADYDRLLQILDETSAESPEIAAELRARVEQFDYTRILELVPSPSAA